MSIVCDPTATSRRQRPLEPRSLDTLAGKVVGFIDNAKPNFHHLVDDLAERLARDYGVARVLKRGKRVASIPAPEDVIAELVDQCDLVITGSGD